MAKKIVAVTGIKHSQGFIEAGEKVDPSKFTREELRTLLDSGAILVTEGDEELKAEDLTPEQLGTENAQTQDVSAQAKQGTADLVNEADEKPETKSTTATKATPAKK